MEDRLVFEAIDKGAELGLYSARLAKKTFLNGKTSKVDAVIEIAKAYGQLEALEQLCGRMGMDGAAVAENVRASRERIEEIHAEVCMHGLQHETQNKEDV